MKIKVDKLNSDKRRIRKNTMQKRLTPIKAIRKICLECMGYSWVEVKRCIRSECPLFEFRFGKNPARKGRKLSPEHPFLRKGSLPTRRVTKDSPEVITEHG
jgi:hypothetical protein